MVSDTPIEMHQLGYILYMANIFFRYCHTSIFLDSRKKVNANAM